MSSSWLAVRKPLPAKQALSLKAIAFLIPVVLWCVVSYVPFVWHPLVKVTDKGATYWQTTLTIDGTWGSKTGNPVPANPPRLTMDFFSFLSNSMLEST